MKTLEADGEQRLADAMEQYGDQLTRTAFLLLRDRRDAEEAVADTFLQYYCKADSFRGECALSTWLTRILVNYCRQRLRSSWLRRVLPTDGELPAPDVFGGQEQLVERMAVSQAVQSLKTADREVIVLFYYRDMSVREVAYALGQRENTVRSRLTRARDALRLALKEDDFDE